MTFIVLYDANVLYPNVLRDVVIRLAQTGLVYARWSERILDETFRNLAVARPGIPTETLVRLRELMNRAVPDCLVTANLRHFTDTELAQFGIQALHPDEFVMDLFTLDGARVHQVISATAAAWRNPPGTPADVCDRLAAAGLPISAAALRR